MIEIPLTQGMVAVIDDCDAHLAAFKWHAAKHRKTYYAKREEKVAGKARTIYLHREVLGVSGPAVQVDHKDGNGLDCRRENLRPATPSQNRWNAGPARHNTSGFRNVYWYPAARRWVVRVPAGSGRRLTVGSFKTIEEAIRAADAARTGLHGAFAHVARGVAP